jgi:hypothetical protein
LTLRIALFATIGLFLVAHQASAAQCSVADIQIKSSKARFVDGCTRSRCPAMKGVAVLHNGCGEAVGVQVQMTGYDRAGAPLATRELWPASIRNIPPGDYTFSLDSWLEWQEGMASTDMKVIAVKRWR